MDILLWFVAACGLGMVVLLPILYFLERGRKASIGAYANAYKVWKDIAEKAYNERKGKEGDK